MWQSMNRWLLLAEVVEHWTGMQETRVQIPTEARFVSAARAPYTQHPVMHWTTGMTQLLAGLCG